MRYAILSDIHANPNALACALGDARDLGVEKVICLGDVVGYGPNPVKAVELVRSCCDVTLMGNHDAAVSGVMSTASFNATAVKGVLRHQKVLGAKDMKWLATLPYLHEEADFVCAHGSTMNPKWFNYVFSDTDAKDALEMTSKRLVFVGHTHNRASWVLKPGKSVPETGPRDILPLEDGCRYVVNVGSVGYPRTTFGSWYCVYDTEERRITFQSLPFDLAAYATELKRRRIDLPLWLSDRLACAKVGGENYPLASSPRIMV